MQIPKTEDREPKTDITSVDLLRAIYGLPKGAAAHKVVHRIDEHIAAFIARSPFLLMATIDAAGRMDVSPKGDLPGFVQVEDEATLLYPDRPGNNRIDGLVNIVETGRIGLLFLVPGVKETLRVNGSASVSVAPDLLDRFTVEAGHLAGIGRRYVERAQLPSMGTILAAHTDGVVDQCAYDAELPARITNDLY